jgi:hypothetical protein
VLDKASRSDTVRYQLAPILDLEIQISLAPRLWSHV